jgi:hypothetical protein
MLWGVMGLGSNQQGEVGKPDVPPHIYIFSKCSGFRALRDDQLRPLSRAGTHHQINPGRDDVPQGTS